jgi:hypothetical protein
MHMIIAIIETPNMIQEYEIARWFWVIFQTFIMLINPTPIQKLMPHSNCLLFFIIFLSAQASFSDMHVVADVLEDHVAVVLEVPVRIMLFEFADIRDIPDVVAYPVGVYILGYGFLSCDMLDLFDCL